MTVGIFGFVGGLLIGPISDYMGKNNKILGAKKACVLANLIFGAALLASLISHFTKSYLSCFFTGALL